MYPGYVYEVILNYKEKDEIISAITPSKPELVLRGENESIEDERKAHKLILDGKKFNSLQKKIGDVDKLSQQNPNVGIIKWIAADAMNDLAEQKRYWTAG